MKVAKSQNLPWSLLCIAAGPKAFRSLPLWSQLLWDKAVISKALTSRLACFKQAVIEQYLVPCLQGNALSIRLQSSPDERTPKLVLDPA